jgi:large subunit ribosomal protein L4
MQVDVFDIQGAKTGRVVELPEVFGIEPNDHVVYLAVKQFLAARRQGTHKVKTRAEVHGSSRKLHKQKGTGGSRKGNIRNPLYKGGGTIFGPKPHGYDFKLNRKVRDLAKFSALTYKANSNDIFILEDVRLETPKTKQITAMLNTLNLSNKKVLFITSEFDENVYLSTRNVPSIQNALVNELNTYDIVNANVLVISESAIRQFELEEMFETEEGVTDQNPSLEA